MLIQDTAPVLASPEPLRLGDVALFLDLDGTLAPIAARPRDVTPDRRRTRLLERLGARLDGRLAIVSGRTLADVDRILEGRVAAVAAVHGLVIRRPDGRATEAEPHPGLAAAVAAIATFAGRDPGLIVEEKGLSITLHYRLAPRHAVDARAMALALARETGLTLQEGDMVCELRTPGPTKGDSVRTFMAEAPFAGAVPVFLGDDITDEDGFAAAEALGGVGVAIGPRPSRRATLKLAGVAETLDWLEAVL